jgi:hypothetical protein
MRTIMVVAPPNLPRANRLVNELFEMGWDVELAETPSRAAEAAEAIACVIVLTRDEWRDPAIIAAIRTRPAILIPVFCDPMQLPSGPWTAAPIEMRLPPPEVAGYIIETIEASGGGNMRQSATRSRPYVDKTPSRPRDPSRSYPGLTSRGTAIGIAPMAPNATSKVRRRKKKSQVPSIINTFLGFAILAGLVFGGYQFYQHPSWQSRIKAYLPWSNQQPTSVSTNPKPYQANIPGKDCDKGSGQWLKATDAKFTFTCQDAGLLISQSDNYNSLSGAYFLGAGAAIPASYHVDVSATITSNEGTNTVALLIRPKKVDGSTISGGYYFQARANGSWWIYRVTDTGEVNVQLGMGFIAATKTLKLSVDASGPIMTYKINDAELMSVTDATYPTTAGIGLAISNPGGAAQTSVVFSKFNFNPLSAPTLSSDNAVATATAQMTGLYQQAYTAATPGPGCDKGKGQWAPSTYFGLASQANCDNAVFTLTKPAKSTGNEIFVGFYGINGIFPDNYKVSLAINAKSLNDGCAIIKTRLSAQGAYKYSICQDGSTEFHTIDNTGKDTLVKTKWVAKVTTYNVTITESKDSHTLSINNVTAITAADNKLASTSYITVGLVAAPAYAASVGFTNFSLTAA